MALVRVFLRQRFDTDFVDSKLDLCITHSQANLHCWLHFEVNCHFFQERELKMTSYGESLVEVS